MIKRLLPLFLFSLLLVMFTGCFEDDESIPGAELEVSLSVNKSTVKTGEKFTFIASATGGADEYKYEWKLNSDNWSDGSSVQDYTKNSSGSYKCEVRVTSGSKTATATKTVRVEDPAPQLSVSLKADKPQVKPGESISLKATVDADESGLKYYWKEGNGSWGSEGSKSKTFGSKSSEGSYTYHFKVVTPTQEKEASATVKVSSEEPATYPWHHNIIASLFWVGEEPNEDNHFIQNLTSAWDGKWLENFGNVEDDPHLDSLGRGSDGYPSNYNGSQNPYYFALPYNDFGSLVSDLNENPVHDLSLTSGRDTLTYKNNRKNVIPWAADSSGVGSWESMCKNRWVEIKINGKSCYAQWEDSGPFFYNDIDYVFGTSRPINESKKSSNNLGAGIDLSPAVMFYLDQRSDWEYKKAKGMVEVSWRFVDDADVPSGPWKNTVTKNQISGWN